jgi:hypothetical protein
MLDGDRIHGFGIGAPPGRAKRREGRGRQERASFCEQKEAKKLFCAGAWALAVTQPMAQHKRSFCAAFFKKRPLAL